MAKVAIQKIEIIAHLPDSKKIMERLQRRGVVEISNYEDPELIKVETDLQLAQFEKGIVVATEAKQIINNHFPVKKSLLASFNGRTEIDFENFENWGVDWKRHLKSCYQIVSLVKASEEAKANNIRLETQMRSLEDWLVLDVPMQYQGTKHTQCFIGTFAGQITREELLAKLAKNEMQAEMVDIEIVNATKQMTYVCVNCHKDDKDEVLASIREIGFTYPSDPTKHPPVYRMERFKKQMEENKRLIEENEKKISAFGDINQELEYLMDYLVLKKDRYEAFAMGALSKRIFIINGYVPERNVSALMEELEKEFELAISISETTSEDDAPVILQNNGFMMPAETITEMYSMPGKSDIDPTSVMAFFYYFFFGMMLSDAGYGLVMAIGSWLILKKTTIEGGMRKTMQMFFYCGIFTIFWGAMFGSWFGDIVQVVAREFFGKELGSIALWYEPIQDPMNLLVWCFIFGIVHLLAGVLARGKMTWDEGKKFEAIIDTLPVLLIEIGIAPVCGTILTSVPAIAVTIGTWMSLVGVVILVLTASRSSKNIIIRLFGGLYALYNLASGYLSDVLSYSRLLALGLATGSIASVINMMGTMVTNPILKPIVLLVVFLFGHLLNLAINALGAYVHANRLQFVELFSKFYEGGGRSFKPYTANTKYIKFKED